MKLQFTAFITTCKNITNMKKNLFLTKFFVTLLMFFTSSAMHALTYKIYVNGIYYNVNTNDWTAKVGFKDQKYNTYSGSINIPETIVNPDNGASFRVNGIDYDAFRNCKNLTSVSFGSNIKSIGSGAFRDCTALKNMTIPSGVESIGNMAFYYSGITTLHMEQATSLKSIGSDAFYGVFLNTIFLQNWGISYWMRIKFDNADANPCNWGHPDIYMNGEKLTEIEVPNYNNLPVGAYSFYGFSKISTIKLMPGIKTIEKYAFSYCTGISNITLPNTLTDIGEGAFSFCSGIKSITLPESIKSIGKQAFHATGITEVKVPSSLQTLGLLAFGTKVHTMELCCPSIGKWFSNIDSLKHVLLKNNVKTIEKDAFANINLSSLTLPQTLERIAIGAFKNSSIYNLYVDDISKWCCVTIDDSNSGPMAYSKHLYVNGSEVINQLTIPEGVEKIGKYAFEKCKIKMVDIPTTMNRIEEDAFKECDSLKIVNIKDIEAWCKMNFSNAEANPLTYARHLFCSGEEITNLILANRRINIINKYAFNNCESLTSITIKGLAPQYFYGDAFKGCVNLKTVNVDSIGSWCAATFANVYSNPLIYAHHLYMNNEEVTKVIIPSGYTKIGAFALYSCENIKTIYIPASVENIGESAFHSIKGDLYILGNPKDQDYDLYVKNKFLNGFKGTIYSWSGSIEGKADHYFDNLYLHIGPTSYNLTDRTVKYIEATILEAKNTQNNMELEDGLDIKSKGSTLSYYIQTKEHGKIYQSREFPIFELSSITPKVINKGEVILCATTTMADDETHAGFEWRKLEAPDVIPSKSALTIVYNGRMEGLVKNIDANSFYKMRPYYKTSSGKEYFGEWIGFDPSDFSYFEPTVQTYDFVQETDGEATFVGYAIQGSEDIDEQGFEYWVSETISNIHGFRAPSNGVTRVKATGQRMTAKVSGLAPGTIYGYRAYVVTSKGTTYGEEYTFTTSGVSSMENVVSSTRTFGEPHGVFNLSGVKIADSLPEAGRLTKGIYIVNGKKMVVR